MIFPSLNRFLPDQLKRFGDGTIYVAFRGTDTSIAGWREDLNFSYMSSTPAQLCAAEYLNLAAERTYAPIRTGGHSKGGNLAIYATVFCEERYKERIIKIYSNDGPGFNESVTENPGYRNMLDKLDLIIPEGSMVGVMLFNKQEKQIIQSTAKAGTGQHIPYSWVVNKDGFVLAEKQSSLSIMLDRTLDSCLMKHQRRYFWHSK